MAPLLLSLNLKWRPLNLKATATATNKVTEVPLPEKIRNSRILVLGGTGRVGGSTAIALSNFCPDLQILVAGRNREKGEALTAKLGGNAEFVRVDIDDVNSLETALKRKLCRSRNSCCWSLPMRRKVYVLEAAINTKTAYIDVCDDTNYAWRAKSLMKRASDANVPAIITTGIDPGVSNVMAAELVRAANESKDKPEKLGFYSYTAGTGGAGPTLLATTLLLLGEEVVVYNKGEKIRMKPYSAMLNIDFGNGIGKRDVYLMNLPQVRSAHQILRVPTVSARFGTAPFFWNWGMESLTTLVTPEFLRDRNRVQSLVQLFGPFVRALDGITGERVSMRVDLECASGRHTVGVFSHERLSVSVGISTAAFALAVLEGSTQPGVWFPEEPQGIPIEAREALLERASQGTFNFVMNRSPWRV
ncbi:saccharopine dehydrogenase [Vigna unguiculata]|uniref:Saccharopine dehydrogenase n=1 Tax=Vigna unguiculata TaxID=3917 RepID=A0A4D6LJQ6_VIGUN|nr:saccharopine dehydrogenase [Vigna unguiculata]